MKTKTRSLPIIPSVLMPCPWIKSGSWSGSGSSNFPIPAYYPEEESITYGVGRRQTNYCAHTKVFRAVNKTNISGLGWKPTAPTELITETYSAGVAYEVNQTATWGAGPALVLDDPTWTALSSRAVQLMWPEIESKVSLANFVLELKDFSRIWALVKQFDTWLNRFSYSKLKRPTLSQISRFLSGGVLTSEFAIRPLISDISGFHQVFLNARNDVNRLLSNEGKPLVSHCRLPIESITPSRTDDRVVNATYGNYYYRRQYDLRGAWYNATMRYSYRLLDYQRAQAHDLGRWDALGLNLNPAIIWNALPWSFVVDWFARVGGFLDQAKIRNIEPIVSIDGFCHSKKIEYSITQLMLVNGDRAPSNTFGQVSRTFHSDYLRTKDVPDTYTAVKLSGLNTREFILSSALLGSRRR